MTVTNPCPYLFDDPRRSSRPTFEYADPLPMTSEELQKRGWDQVDVVFITGDAYVDAPSFANGLLARLLEADGFSVAVLSQPDWNSVEDFRKFGRPRLAFCVSAGNMDSMLNHYTASRKIRNDDSYTPGGKIGRRPDRATLSYCQRAREAFPGVPILTGGVEASLRRITHYDYWSDRVRRSILLDAKADLLMYGMGERPILEILRRLADGESPHTIRDVRGTVYRLGKSEDLLEESDSVVHLPSFEEVTGTDLLPEQMFEINRLKKELGEIRDEIARDRETQDLDPSLRNSLLRQTEGIEKKIEKIRQENVNLSKRNFVEMTKIAYDNLNPYCAKTLLQECGEEAIVVNPPAYPLSEREMNAVYALPFTRKPHPFYKEPIPAADVVGTTVQTHRGCFGGCTFCAITAHQGKFIQNRSEDAIIEEIQKLVESIGGECTISDLNAPTANMYRLGGKNENLCVKCKKFSCLCPQICKNLDTDQSAYVELLRRVRAIKHVKKVLVASGIRTDLATLSIPFIGELAAYHTGGHLKTAPEHVDNDVLKLMNKPPIENHELFCKLFEQESRKSGKEQYTVPYLISGFPGSTIKSMVDVAVYLKKHGVRPEQVQDFIPAPFQLATCAYYTGIDPVTEEPVYVPKTLRERRLQRALLFYYNPAFYNDVKSALKEAGREDLIGSAPECLIPSYLPKTYSMRQSSRVKFLKRQTEKEKQEKEKRRAEFQVAQQEASSFSKRESRVNHKGTVSGYRTGARAFGQGGNSEKTPRPYDPRSKERGHAKNEGNIRRSHPDAAGFRRSYDEDENRVGGQFNTFRRQPNKTRFGHSSHSESAGARQDFGRPKQQGFSKPFRNTQTEDRSRQKDARPFNYDGNGSKSVAGRGENRSRTASRGTASFKRRNGFRRNKEE